MLIYEISGLSVLIPMKILMEFIGVIHPACHFERFSTRKETRKEDMLMSMPVSFRDVAHPPKLITDDNVTPF